ncbi:uncharacterized protein LOC131165814 [Malania oleifera]|uniref:uncharacterized protein LOC131165814 n=1 Tax=Malania oleifera TaxID=397392 RepID=UPI0025AE545F|nr:uncharacterized protein LOC131165814 [Malania oleifera]
MATYNLFVKLLDGKTLTLRLDTPTITGELIKHRLYGTTRIPVDHQLLLAEGRHIYSDTLICAPANTRLFPTVHLLLRLLGGKGGFGSLLRGAASKAGQKKTNNFDACRDMSGRRLRHVNAEKKLEEWQAEAEQRRLEKIAEEFIKKKAKTGKKLGNGETEKYVARYREESAKCVEAVEASVRDALEVYKNSKRKSVVVPEAESKRLKIWTGKKSLDESDSDMDEEDSDEDDDKEEENEKSVVLDSGNNSDSNKEMEGSSRSLSCGKLVGECSNGGSSDSGSEEEKEIVLRGSLESSINPGKLEAPEEVNGGVVEPEVYEEKVVHSTSYLEAVVVLETDAAQAENLDSHEPKSGIEEIASQQEGTCCPGAEQDFEVKQVDARANGFPESKSGVNEGTEFASKEDLELEKPLNFDEFNSATEMEALGMEKLKSELQARGLKCGGTLQERAARLFLLKTTPIEKLPKKLLAKK